MTGMRRRIRSGRTYGGNSGRKPYAGRRSRTWCKVVALLLILCVAGFAVLEGIVLVGGTGAIHGSPTVMVIFGCKVEPWGPSILLQDRLDTALAHLAHQPDMTVVVTGGQGSDEPMTEAQAMRDYLVAHGVAGEQIVLEDRASNTWENIKYTQALFQSGAVAPTGEILAVSSGFHLARIRMLWAREWEGAYTLSTLAAPASHTPSRMKMYVREPLALVKSFLFDR